MSGQIGFYGKLPGAGDFVQRRLPAAFVDSWDRHFQRALETGRRELDGQWAQAWRDGLAWRFVLPAQVCGDGAWCGLIGPAEDRVGRAFPMTLAAPCAGDPAAMLGDEAWFDALERVYRGAQYEAVSVETFDARVAALPHPLRRAHDAAQVWHGLDWSGGQWQLTSDERTAAAVLLTQAWRQLSAQPGAWCLWWTQRARRLLATRGLPRSYAALLEPAPAPEWTAPSTVHAFAHDDRTGGFELAPSWPARPDAASDSRVYLDEWREHIESGTKHDTASAASSDTIWRRTAQTSAASPPGASLSVTQNIDTSALSAPASRSSYRDAEARASRAALPEPLPELADAALLYLDHGRTLLISADDGPPDPRRRAALSIRAAALTSGAPDLHHLQASLLPLHAPLCAISDDPLEPVNEEGVALAVRFIEGRVHLLRIGAASAWHWRRGVLRPLFVERSAGAGGEFDDLLFGDAWFTMPGLGTSEPPHRDEAIGEFEAGDRLVLLATRALAQLPQGLVSEALRLPGGDDARAYLAACAGLGAQPAQWPLAVIGSDA